MTTLIDSLKSLFIFVKNTNSGIVEKIAIPSEVQIGLSSNPTGLDILGRLSVSTTNFSATVSNKGIINLKNEDTIVDISDVDSTLTQVNVNLPSNPQEGQLNFIKDSAGIANSINFIISAGDLLIDGATTQTISSLYGSMAFYFWKNEWHVLIKGGSGGGTTDASYVVMGNDPTLTSERVLTAGSGITITDNGANSTVVISSNVSGDTTASYLVLNNTASLSNERAFVPGTGLKAVDAGANNTYTLSINDNVIATVSGTVFTGNVVATTGLSGSLQKTANGISYLTVNEGLTLPNVRPRAGIVVLSPPIQTLSIISQSNGQILISQSIPTLAEVLQAGQSTVDSKFAGFYRGADIILGNTGGTYDKLTSTNQLIIQSPNDSDTAVTISANPPDNLGQGANLRLHAGNNQFATLGNIQIEAGFDNILGTSGFIYIGGDPANIDTISTGSNFYKQRVIHFKGHVDTEAHFFYSNGLPLFTSDGSITINSQSNGQIALTGSGGGGGSSTTWIDGGLKLKTSSSVAISGNDNQYASSYGTDVYFYVSGSQNVASGSDRKMAVFNGDTRISGSLTIGTGSITITSNDLQFGNLNTRIQRSSSDMIFFDINNPTGKTLTDLASGGGGSGGTGFIDGVNRLKTTASVAIDSDNQYANFYGTDVFFYVSGTKNLNNASAKKSLFNGDITNSGSFVSFGGISGSLTRLSNNTSYLVAGSNITISSASTGQITISSTGGGGSGGTSDWTTFSNGGANWLVATASVAVGTTEQSSAKLLVHDSASIVLQDFETTSPGNLPTGWTTDGDANWTVSSSDFFSGAQSVKAGTIADNQTTNVYFDTTSSLATQIMFAWKVSSENNFDFLRFFIDGNQQKQISGLGAGWQQISASILTSGSHRYKWSYSKDSSSAAGSDTGWVDYVQIKTFNNVANFRSNNVVVSGSLQRLRFPLLINSSYSVQNYDDVLIVRDFAAPGTITLPLNPLVGQEITIKRAEASGNTVTVDGNGSTIDGSATINLGGSYGKMTLIYVGNNVWSQLV